MTFVNAGFPASGVKTTLCFALVSVCIVVVTFAYLTFRMRKPYFRMWAVSWLFYSMYVAAAIEQQRQPGPTFFGAVGHACVGLSALWLLWGSLQLTGRVRPIGELGVGALLILVCSFAAPPTASNQIWVARVMFFLLALVS